MGGTGSVLFLCPRALAETRARGLLSARSVSASAASSRRRRRRSARRMAVRGGRYSRGQAHCQEDPDRLPRRTYPSQVDAGLAFTLAVELVLVKGLRGAVGSTPLGRMGARGRRARMPTWCMTTSTIACTMARRSSAPQMTGMLARSVVRRRPRGAVAGNARAAVACLKVRRSAVRKGG